MDGLNVAKSVTLSEFGLNDPSLFVDPYPLYSRALRESSVHYCPHLWDRGAWVILGHAEAKEFLQDRRLSSDRANIPLRTEEMRAGYERMYNFLKKWVAFHDGDAHRELRRHIMQAFSFSETAIQSAVNRAVDAVFSPLQDAHHIEVMGQIAQPLASRTIVDLLSLPIDDHEEINHWSDSIAHLFGSSTLTSEDLERGQEATIALHDYLRTATQNGGATTSRLLSQLLSTVGFDDPDMAYAQCVQLLFAGLEPTRYLLANAILALEANPKQRDRVVGDLASDVHLDAIVEETLRYDTPVQFATRTVPEDFTSHGCQFRAGQIVLCYVSAANRDPLQYSRPEEFDIADPSRGHLAFGWGPHYCIGTKVVRLIIREGIRALLKYFPHYSLDPDSPPEYNVNLGFHGPRKLDLVSTVASPPTISPTAGAPR